jgi:hypothetical protein
VIKEVNVHAYRFFFVCDVRAGGGVTFQRLERRADRREIYMRDNTIERHVFDYLRDLLMLQVKKKSCAFSQHIRNRQASFSHSPVLYLFPAGKHLFLTHHPPT